MNSQSDLTRHRSAAERLQHARAGVVAAVTGLRRPAMFALLLAVVVSGMTLSPMGPRALADGTPVPKDAVSNAHVTDFFLEDLDGINGNDLLAKNVNDNKVLTNDEMQYRVHMRPKRNITNPVIRLTLPQGIEFTTATGECLSPAASPKLPEPGFSKDDHARWVGIDAGYWKSNLPSQVVTCRLDNSLFKDQVYAFPFVAKVRSEVPNATVLKGAKAQLLESSTSLGVSNQLSVQVVSAPRFNVQIGSASNSSGATCEPLVFANNNEDSNVLSGRSYVQAKCGMTITAPAGGLGVEPLAGNYSFGIDLDPNRIYQGQGVKTTDMPAYKANGWSKYRPYVDAWYSTGVFGPHNRITPGNERNTAENSVRRSSHTMIEEAANTSYKVTIDSRDGDLSGYTCPTRSGSQNSVLPADRCFVASQAYILNAPYEALTHLGNQARADFSRGNSTNWRSITSDSIQISMGFSANITGTSISGQKATTFRTDNSRRSMVATMSSEGNVSQAIVGLPGASGNRPSGWWQAGIGWQGPAGSDSKGDGMGRLVEDQVLLNVVQHSMRAGSTDRTSVTADAACTVFDPRLNLSAGAGQVIVDDGTRSNIFRASDVPNNAAASVHGKNQPVWLTDFDIKDDGRTGNQLIARARDGVSPSPYLDFHIQYGVVDYNQASAKTAAAEERACLAPAGTIWRDDPAKVPGNDPAKLAEGIYTAPNAVRILFVNKRPDLNTSMIRFAMAMTRDDGVQPGQALGVRQHYPNKGHGQIHQFTGQRSLTWDRAVAVAGALNLTTHRSVYSSGATIGDPQVIGAVAYPGSPYYGDRVVSASVVPDVAIAVKSAGAKETDSYQTKRTTIAAGQTFPAQLTPQLISPVTSSKTYNYRAELCLPGDVTVKTNTASVVPTAEYRGDGAKATTINCAAGSNVYQWDLGHVSMPHADLDTCTDLPQDTSSIDTGNLDVMENDYGCRIVGGLEPITMELAMSTVAADGDLSIAAGSQVIGEPVSKDPRRTVDLSVLSAKTAGLIVDTYGSSLLDVNPFKNAPSPTQGGFVLGYFNRGLSSSGAVEGVEVQGMMPRSGVGASGFNGSAALTGYKVVEGDERSVTAYYTTDQVIYNETTQQITKTNGANPAWKAWDRRTSVLRPATAVKYVYKKPLSQNDQVQVAFTYEGHDNRTGNAYEIRAVGASATFPQRISGATAQTVKGGSIGDLVWADGNDNGIQDLVRLSGMLDSEHGIGGVPVTIRSMGNTARGLPYPENGEHSILTVDAGLRDRATGTYVFDNLPEGTYRISVSMAENSTLKSRGYLGMAKQNQGDDEGLDSDMDASGIAYDVTLAKHQDLNSVDAGIIGRAELTMKRYGGQVTRDYAWAGSMFTVGIVLENTGTLPIQDAKVTDTFTGQADPNRASLLEHRGAGGTFTPNPKSRSMTWKGNIPAGEQQDIALGYTLHDPKTVYEKVERSRDTSYEKVALAATIEGSWSGGAANVACIVPGTRTRIQVVENNRLIKGVDMKTACGMTQPVAYPYVTSSVDFTDHGSSVKSLDGKGAIWNETAGNDRFGPNEPIAGEAQLINHGNVPVRVSHERFGVLRSTGAAAAIYTVDRGEIVQGACSDGRVADAIAAKSSCSLSLLPQPTFDQGWVDAMTASNGDGGFTGEVMYRLWGDPAGDAVPVKNSWQDQTNRRTVQDDFFFAESTEQYHREGGLMLLNGSLTDASGNGVIERGEDITVSYTLVNTGNLTITNPTVTDPLGGTLVAEPSFDGALSPGESVTMAKRTTSDATTDLVVTAKATGTLPLKGDTFAKAPASSLELQLALPLRSSSGLDLRVDLKDATGDGVLTAGEEYWYEVLATNTGTDTFSDVSLSAKGTPALPTWEITQPAGTTGATLTELAPGGSIAWRTKKGAASGKGVVATPPNHEFIVKATSSDGKSVASNRANLKQPVFTGPVLAPVKAG